jgi:hypothetical protein
MLKFGALLGAALGGGLVIAGSPLWVLPVCILASAVLAVLAP